MKKKGIQLNEAFSAVLVLVAVAVLVIVALVIFSSLNPVMYSANTAASSINETLAKATATGITLTTGSAARGGVCGPITHILNTTGNYDVGLGNITQTGCLVQNKSTSTEWADLGATWKYTYTYTYSADNGATNASNVLITQFGTYPVLVGLVGTVIFLGIIIGVLVASFAFGRKGV